jgi:hypothetical protein
MKLFRLFLLLITVVIVLLQTDCDTTPIDPHPGFTDTLFQSQDFLDYWYFNEGSWWVYKRTDTSADVYDTVRAVKSWVKLSFSPLTKPYAFEQYFMNVEHDAEHFKNTGLKVQYNATANHVLSSQGGYYYFDASNFFIFPINIGTSSFAKVLDTTPVLLDTNLVHNCVHIELNAGGHRELWIAKGLGFIKYLHFDGTFWELVNYKIEN